MPPPPQNEVSAKEDDLGYETAEEPGTKAPEAEAKPDDKKEDDKVEKPATGYGKKPEEAKPDDEKIVEEKKDATEVSDEEKLKNEFTEVLKDLPDSVDKEKVSKFASENKFTKEQLQAYTNLVKSEQKAFDDNQKKAVENQRNGWEKELKEDPEFGGEHFDKNLDKAEKVLEKYMPNTKKVLTEKGSMLPPYVMRDFLALYKVLNPTSPLVIGDTGEVTDDSDGVNEMYS